MRAVMLVAVSLVVLLLAACDGAESSELRVSAAASLTDAFAEIEAAFEAEHREIDVVLNLGGSSTLREQIAAGAPVDVYASADSTNMDALVATGDVIDPQIFAGNRLAIAAAPGNPAAVTGLAGFAEPGPLFGLCAPSVPCGGMAGLMFAAARIVPSIDSEEPNVRALLTKIEAGELDAGIVYATDVLAAGDAVVAIAIPDDQNVFTDYPIAIAAGASSPEEARVFVDFVMSPQGQAILEANGFVTW